MTLNFALCGWVHGQMTGQMIFGGESVGFSRRRSGIGGRVRYTAYFVDLHGRERSAGTFAVRKDADRAWQKAELELAAADGRNGAKSAT